MAPTRLGDGTNIDSIRLGDGTEIAEVRTGAGDVVFSGVPEYDISDDITFTSVNDMTLSGGDTIYLLTDNNFIDSWVLSTPNDVSTASYVGRFEPTDLGGPFVGIASDYQGENISCAQFPGVNFGTEVDYQDAFMSTPGDITTASNNGTSGKNHGISGNVTSHLYDREYPDDSRGRFFDVNDQDDTEIYRYRWDSSGEDLHSDGNDEAGQRLFTIDGPCTGATMRFDDFTDLTLTDSSNIYRYPIQNNDPVSGGGSNNFNRKIDVSNVTTNIVGVCGVSSTDDFYHIVDASGVMYTIVP